MRVRVSELFGEQGDESLTYHVLSQLQVLGEIHSMFNGVVSVALDHHVRNWFAWPCVSRDKLGDDIEESAIVSGCRSTKNAPRDNTDTL
jgi:hypothetical protein